MAIRMVKERKDKGLTQMGLARLAEMHLSSVSQIETGRLKPWPGQKLKIAQVLEWPEDKTDELFEEVDDARD